MALQNIEANITLDLYNHDTTPSTVKAIQLDSQTRYVAAMLQNMGAQYDVDSGATVQLTVIRPDKVGVQISGTTFTYGDDGAQFLGPYAELTLVALAVSGKLLGQFKITSGTQILRTEIFAISNGEALDASTDEWADEYDGYNLEEMATSIETNTADIASLEADVSQIKEDFNELDAKKGSAIYGTASGEIASFSNGSDDGVLKINAISEQATTVYRMGKNILPNNMLESQTSGTLEMTPNADGSFTINKTGNSWATIQLLKDPILLKAGTYTICEIAPNNASQGSGVTVYNSTTSADIINTRYIKSQVFTLAEDTNIKCRFSRQSTASDVKIYFALFIGNVLITEASLSEVYEPYNGVIKSPNETIKTAKGINNVWADVGSINVTYISDTKEYIDNGIKDSFTTTETVDYGVVENGSIDTAAGTNIETTTGRKRTVSFVPDDVTTLSFANTYTASVYAYKRDNGAYVGLWTGNGWSTDYTQQKWLQPPVELSIFEEYDCIYRVLFAPQSGTSDALNLQFKKDLKIEFAQNTIEHYTVGTNGNFTTFTAMLAALKDNINEKIVTVASGEYDIFEEVGGAAFVSSADTTKGWREYNYVVPPNTTIVGVGEVILKWTPTDEQIIDQAHAFLFAPLNLMGSCRIENIKIVCSNGRYAIHDETSGINYFNGCKHEFVNVTAIFESSSYGGKYAYGAGHNRNCKYYFKNCIFSAPVEPWSSHDWPATSVQKSTFIFDNCIFKNSTSDALSGLRLSSSDTVGRLDDIRLNGCALSHVSFGAESGDSPIKQGYEVTAMLCNDFTVNYTSRIAEADRIAPKKYLTIPTA